MTDLSNILQTLRRPRLLVRAAHFGLSEYRRERDLRRIMREGPLPAPRQAVGRLIEEEELLEETRRAGNAGYNVTRHVEVLVALVAEAQAAIASTRVVPIR